MCGPVNKTEQVKALKNGMGVQYLLDEAYKIFGNPMSMHDMDDKTVAYTQSIVTDDPYWNECVTYGAVSSETLDFFRSEYFIYDIANVNTVTSLISDKFKYDRIFGKIYIENSVRVFNLCMIACKKPFEDDDREVFEEFCKVLSKELRINDIYLYYGKIYQETLIRQLIDGSYEDKKYYAARVEDIYRGLKSYLYLAVADVSRSGYGHSMLRYFTDLFNITQPEFKYSIYNDYIVIIMSAEHTVLNIEKVCKLYSLFEKHNILVGISGSFENLFESHKHYVDAVNELNKGLGAAGGQRIFLHNENE